MTIANYIDLKRMPTGRHAYALTEVLARTEHAGLSAMSAAVEEAQKTAEETLQMELEWRHVLNARKTTARGDAVAIDRLVDAQIVAIHKALESDRVGDPGDPVVDAAEQVLTLLFPDGPGAITNLEFEEQLGRMDAIFTLVDQQLTAPVQTLGLGRKLDRLKRLVDEFRQELGAGPAHALTYDDVKAQRAQLHEATCQAIAAILYLAPDAATRAELLAPIDDQQRRVTEARRRHAPVSDVDPETGEELQADEADAVDPIDTHTHSQTPAFEHAEP